MMKFREICVRIKHLQLNYDPCGCKNVIIKIKVAWLEKDEKEWEGKECKNLALINLLKVCLILWSENVVEREGIICI